MVGKVRRLSVVLLRPSWAARMGSLAWQYDVVDVLGVLSALPLFAAHTVSDVVFSYVTSTYDILICALDPLEVLAIFV
jgi:hypothetical protein